MESLTKTQIVAMKELFYVATRYKNGNADEKELHLTVKYVALAFATDSWHDGLHTVQNALQIAGIFTADSELREVYKKMFDDAFYY